jgi:hypothetical protein
LKESEGREREPEPPFDGVYGSVRYHRVSLSANLRPDQPFFL